MRYGKQLVMVANGQIIESSEEQYVNWGTVRKLIKNVETIKVKGAEEALAVFLQLMDAHKSGSAREIGLYCRADDKGQIHMVEKTWVVTDLKEPQLSDKTL